MLSKLSVETAMVQVSFLKSSFLLGAGPAVAAQSLCPPATTLARRALDTDNFHQLGFLDGRHAGTRVCAELLASRRSECRTSKLRIFATMPSRSGAKSSLATPNSLSVA